MAMPTVECEAVAERAASRPSLAQIQVDQIRAADDVFQAIHELEDRGEIGPGLEAVVETDVFRLRRGLCLPCASAACLNAVTGSRLVGDVDGNITIGDMYRVLIPNHGRKRFEDTTVPDLDRGWLVVTPQGDMYHAAVTAISQALGVNAMPVEDFGSVAVFERVTASVGAVALSLDNTFVLKETLRMRPDLVRSDEDGVRILIEGVNGTEFRKFEHGRHVVALTGIVDGTATLIDSFRLPQMELEETHVRVPVERLDTYLNYFHGGRPRAIVFGTTPDQVDDLQHFASKVIVPKDVVATASAFFSRRHGLN